MEFETVSQFEELEFCSSRPILVYGKYRFVRNIPKALVKFGWSSDFRGKPGSRGALGYLYAKALSHRHEFRGVPVVGDFFNQMVSRLVLLKARFKASRYSMGYLESISGVTLA